MDRSREPDVMAPASVARASGNSLSTTNDLGPVWIDFSGSQLCAVTGMDRVEDPASWTKHERVMDGIAVSHRSTTGSVTIAKRDRAQPLRRPRQCSNRRRRRAGGWTWICDGRGGWSGATISRLRGEPSRWRTAPDVCHHPPSYPAAAMAGWRRAEGVRNRALAVRNSLGLGRWPRALRRGASG
jgi:hypothetical protein